MTKGGFFVGREKGKATTEMRKTDPYNENSPEVEIIDLKDIYWVSDAEVKKISDFVRTNDLN